ncbi:MAG: cytosine permease [Spirochaetales bacterium]|nr:cytosine permease [Spirochaetales bacterium]
MSEATKGAKLEELAPIRDENRVMRLWSYIPTWWAAMIVVMIFAVGFFAIHPYGPLNVTQAIVALVISSVFCGVLFSLNAYPGYREGIPYAVQARSSFGTKGAKIATVIRSIPGIAWLGIATWAGGLAINSITQKLWGFGNVWVFFLIFLVINVLLALGGIKAMKGFNTVGGFVLVGIMTLTLIQVLVKGGDLSRYEAFSFEGTWGYGFWSVFAAGVACIITGALNVSDMSRHLVKSKKQGAANWVGHIAGIAPSYAYMLLLGIFYGMVSGTPDPVGAILEISPIAAMGIVMLVFVLAAQISSNLTLNLLPGVHALQDISRKISWKLAVVIVAAISVASCPWILFTSENYFKFMGFYSCFLGPIIGITLADYWIVGKREVNVEALYDVKKGGRYWYTGGFSLAAIIALVVGAGISLLKLEISWMIGLPIAFVIYVVLGRLIPIEGRKR